MIEELDQVVLTEDLPEHSLKAGDVGTVVLVHRDGEGYEVELVAFGGETVAVTSIYADQVRPVREREMRQARAI